MNNGFTKPNEYVQTLRKMRVMRLANPAALADRLRSSKYDIFVIKIHSRYQLNFALIRWL